MEIKKTPEADLEKGRIIFFLMSFAVALSGFFVLLQWQSSETDNFDWKSLGPVFIENEFESINRPEQSAPATLPKNSEPEIVYEDYVIKDDVQAIEKQEDTVVVPPHSMEDERLLSQSKNETIAPNIEATDKEAFVSADTLPQFPGGQTALIRFIYQHIQYPPAALKQRIDGRVWCSFVVEPDGSVSNVQLEKGVYAFLDDEAVRVLKMMPAWLPGRTNGKNVRVKVYMPVVFKR